MRMPTRSLTTLAALALGAVALAGCAGSAPQSVTEACSVIEDGFTDAQTEFGDAMTSLTGGDITAAADVMSALEKKLAELAPKLTNADVKAAFDDFHSGFATISDALGGATDLNELAPDDLTDAATKVQDASTDLAELCG